MINNFLLYRMITMVGISNTYIGAMNSVLKESTCGKFSIKKRVATQADCDLENDRIRLSFNFRDTLKLTPNTYTYLYKEDDAIMGDSATEILSNLEFLLNANGDVLIAGLGLGIMPLILSRTENINSVLIVEKEQEVIDLVWNQLKLPDNFKVVHSDIFNYVADKEYDTIYLDIWSDIDDTALIEMEHLEKLFKKDLKEGGYLGSWRQEIL